MTTVTVTGKKTRTANLMKQATVMVTGTTGSKDWKPLYMIHGTVTVTGSKLRS